LNYRNNRKFLAALFGMAAGLFLFGFALMHHPSSASRLGHTGVYAAASSYASLPQAAPERHPAKEDTYTITPVLKVLKPVDPAVMNDDFQEVRVLAQDKDSDTLEVTYYPLFQQTVGEDTNWRKDDAGMTAYLRPTPAENWDASMRRDLLA
jgi:hypothetical protein